MEKSSKRIGEILIEKGFITEAQVLDALRDQKISGKFLGMILVDKGLISEAQVTEALGAQFDLRVVDVGRDDLNWNLARKFSSSLLVDHKCFPITEDEQTVTVAIVNPLDAVALAKLEEESQPKSLVLVLASDSSMNEVVKEYKQHISQSIKDLLRRKSGPEQQ
ncbi:MAG: hypothetical protein PHT59_05585 [Candidatus Omnitrophica bacterium]|nr:hypothetical protein [Candidatus Omnitrophota bacterium]